MNNAELPAFANPGSDQGPGSAGLTKREYFAAMAMQKMVDFGSWDIREEVIKRSLDFADELLKQLEK